uniref:Uncharacterized protein n=1 Tax=Opuntia streptacantha TaxID=393608 RepID=A0A7C9EF25_OPUST
MLLGVYHLGNFWSLAFQIMQQQVELLAVVTPYIGIAFASMGLGKWLLAFDMHQLTYFQFIFLPQNLNSTMMSRIGFSQKQMRLLSGQNHYSLRCLIVLVKLQRKDMAVEHLTMV